MAEQTQFTTKIIVSGAVDSSLAKAMGISEAAMRKLNELTTKLGSNNKVVAKSYMTFAPELQKAQVQADRLSSSMRRVGEIAAGISIGETIVSGLRTAIGLAEQLGERFMEFAHTSSEVSAQWELMKKGLGNILGNQALSNQIFAHEFQVAVKSPFQAKDLMQAVKRYVAAGANVNTAQWLAERSGDIVAGVGGGAPEMERAALAFGKIMAAGHMSGQEARELKDLGIPFEQTLQKILGVDASGLEKIQKKHGITTDVVIKMVEQLTGPDGMFNKSMEKFAETFKGVETSVADIVQRFEADFGDIENQWIKFFYGTLGGPDIWDKVTAYMDQLKRINQAVFSFTTSIPSSEVLGKFQPYFQSLQNSFTGFNKWLGSFFTDVEIPGQGNELVLNATGEEKLKESLTKVTNFLQDIGNFVTSPEIQDISKWSIDQTSQALKGMFQALQEWAKLLYDLKKGDWGAVLKDLQDSTVTQYTHLKSKYGSTPGYGLPSSDTGRMGVDSWSLDPLTRHLPSTLNKVDSSTQKMINTSNSSNATLQQLNQTINTLNYILTGKTIWTPGQGLGGGKGSLLANTQFGPGVDYVDANGRVHGTPDSDSSRGIGHIHGVPYSLGPGSVALHSDYAEGVLHLKPGQWFTNPRNGKRQQWMDTSGARNKENIDEYVPGNSGVTINYHIYAIETSDANRFAKEHARTIKKHIDNESSHKAKINSKALA
jgi:tape measure domain-containing protein